MIKQQETSRDAENIQPLENIDSMVKPEVDKVEAQKIVHAQERVLDQKLEVILYSNENSVLRNNNSITTPVNPSDSTHHDLERQQTSINFSTKKKKSATDSDLDELMLNAVKELGLRNDQVKALKDHLATIPPTDIVTAINQLIMEERNRRGVFQASERVINQSENTTTYEAQNQTFESALPVVQIPELLPQKPEILEIKPIDLQTEVKLIAEQEARESFNRDPSEHLSKEKYQEIILRLQSDGKIQTREDLKLATDVLVGTFETKRSELFKSELNWLQRRYYSGKELFFDSVSAVGDFLGSVKDGFVNLVEGGVQLGKTVLNLGIKGVQALGAAIESIPEKLSELGTWASEKLSAAKDLLVSAWDTVTSKEFWVKAWETSCSLASGAWSTVCSCAEKVWDTVSDPKKLWSAICTGASALWSLTCNVAEFAWNRVCDLAEFGWCCITDPVRAAEMAWNGIKALGGFLKSVSDSIGLSSLLSGAWHLVTMPYEIAKQGFIFLGNSLLDTYKLATGQITAEEFANRMIENATNAATAISEKVMNVVDGVVGAVKLFCEVTGLTDIAMCAYHLSRGEWGMAGMHAGFALMSIGSIAATVATGGAACGSILAVMSGKATLKQAAKTVLKAATKNFCKKGAEEIGEAAIKELIERGLSKEALAALGYEVAESTARELSEVISRTGVSLTTELVENTAREQALKASAKALEEAGLTEITESLVREFIESSTSRNIKKSAAHFSQRFGMNADEALVAVKEMRNMLKAGADTSEIQEILVLNITEKVSDYMILHSAESFKGTFANILRGAGHYANDSVSVSLRSSAKEAAEKFGKTLQNYTDELVEAGSKGYRKGVKEAVEKSVREGVERAMKRKYQEQNSNASEDKDSLLESKTAGDLQQSQQEIEDLKTNDEVDRDRKIANEIKYESGKRVRCFTIRDATGKSLNVEVVYCLSEDGEEILSETVSPAVDLNPQAIIDNQKASNAKGLNDDPLSFNK